MHDRAVTVIGAGTMGSGIAQSAVLSGFRVQLIDRDRDAAAAGRTRIARSLDKAVAADRIDDGRRCDALGRLSLSDDLGTAAAAALIIEAIIEDAAAKHALFADLSERVSPRAVIATNTSCLSVGGLARALRRPDRFVGLHYFFPAAVNPLVEVIAGPDSAATAVDAVLDFAAATGKRPIRCADVAGFAVNRFFVPYLNEAARLRDEGIAAARIEQVACDSFGTKAGPFRVMDLSKPEIALHAARSLERLGPFYRPAAGLTAMGEGGGTWGVTPAGDAGAAAMDALIRDRLHGAVLLAVAEELGQGVATPDDIDLGASLGLHWTWRPCAEMRRRGRGAVGRLVAEAARRTGQPMPDLDPLVFVKGEETRG